MTSKAIFALAALAGTALAQDSSAVISAVPSEITEAPTQTSGDGAAETTLSILFGPAGAEGFVASVVEADACETTLLIGCAEGASQNVLCQSLTDLAATFVVGPTGYEAQYSTSTLGGTGLLTQSCALEGPVTAATSGICTAAISISDLGINTAVTTVLTVGEAELVYQPVAVTAGASKLPSGASCTATVDLSTFTAEESGSAEATSVSDGAAAPTNMVRSVVKVLVPVAAVAGALM